MEPWEEPLCLHLALLSPSCARSCLQTRWQRAGLPGSAGASLGSALMGTGTDVPRATPQSVVEKS